MLFRLSFLYPTHCKHSNQSMIPAKVQESDDDSYKIGRNHNARNMIPRIMIPILYTFKGIKRNHRNRTSADVLSKTHVQLFVLPVFFALTYQ